MKIKDYKSFSEGISGWELVGPVGPNYGEQDNSPMKKPGMSDVLYSEPFETLVTLDEYQNLYNDYLKKGGNPLQGFNLENLNKVLVVLNQGKN
jgi:hypothetical protein